MVITIQNHVSLLQSFLSNPTSTTPQQAAEATFHITLAAAKSAAPKSAITLAQTTLATLSKTPCISAIPHLLSICDKDPFEALDVFVLSSAAWKALVAAAITAPPEPHLAMRVISCAALNATSMIARCLQPISQTPSEVLRTVKIAKFYCLNAARCSRSFLTNLQQFSPNLLAPPFLNIFDFLALSSFVLLFDHHALLPAHDELRNDVLPLITNTLRTVLEMTHDFSQTDREQVVKRALEATGKHHLFADLHLPTNVLQLLAVLYVMRSVIDTRQDGEKSERLALESHILIDSFLLPFLFDCFELAYEEIVLFREQGGDLFLDTVTHATIDVTSAAIFVVGETGQKESGLDFLLEELSSKNALRSHVAQEALLHMTASHNAKDGWRDTVTTTVLACLRISLNLTCEQADRWHRLATELCLWYVENGKRLTNVIATSQRLFNPSAFSKSDPLTDILSDPITVPLLARLCDCVSPASVGCTPSDGTDHCKLRSPALSRVLEAFELDVAELASKIQDLALASTGYAAVNAIYLLSHVLDSTSTCGAVVSILQCESTNAQMVCAVLNILDPATMQPSTVDAVSASAASAVSNHRAIVCPAVAAFVSRAAFVLGETVSLAQWQQLSTLLESCLNTLEQDSETSASILSAFTGSVLHHAAVALSAIRNSGRYERQTQVTLPAGILSDVEDSLKRLQRWTEGNNGCNLEEERILVREECNCAETPMNCDLPDGITAVNSLREARECFLDAVSLLAGESGGACERAVINKELSLLQDNIRSIARCFQPSTQ